MRIAIDYSPAITSPGTGIGRYTSDLTKALLQLAPEDGFTLYSCKPPSREAAFPLPAQASAASHLRTRVLPMGMNTFLWQRVRAPLPLELFTGRADILHGTNFTLPPTAGMKRIVTVHDLSFLTHPESAAPGIAEMYSRIVPRSLASANHIIAVSQHTADDLIALLGVAREKISVIYLGVDPRFSPVREPAQLAALDACLGLQHPLVLAVSTIEPRKNFPALIAAFASARLQPGGPRMLAISGRKGWLYDETFAAAKKYAVEDVVRFLDFVPDADLATLYSTADVLAMPSIDEGFGLPAVEAMACGTPVVVSTAGALPEVVGDAGVCADVMADGALVDALVRVTADAAMREVLVARGLERARNFTWARTARGVLDVYMQVTGQEGTRSPATDRLSDQEWERRDANSDLV